MVLGKRPVPGRPTDLDNSRARAYCACSRCGWVFFFFFFTFFSLYYFSFFFPFSGRRPDIDCNTVSKGRSPPPTPPPQKIKKKKKKKEKLMNAPTCIYSYLYLVYVSFYAYSFKRLAILSSVCSS